MDLHAWITQQVDRVEASALAELEYRRVTFEPGLDGQPVTGTITAVSHGPGGLNLAIAQRDVEPRDETPAPVQSAATVLRRCEADRRILARHNVDPDAAESPIYATACEGCGRWGEFDYPNAENLNECPELLDLAHAHGITPEILAGLDQPQPPEPKPRTDEPLGLAKTFTTPPATTSDVPAALRGPRWKP
jgi:hypothetical protein